MQDGHEVGWLSLYSLELLAFVDDPEVGRHQARHVRVAKLHRQVVTHVRRAHQDGDDGATGLVPEKRNAVTHTHQSLVACVVTHRAGANLHTHKYRIIVSRPYILGKS